MFCPACGKQIPDESKFCLHCGHALPPSAGGGNEGGEKAYLQPSQIKRVIFYFHGPMEQDGSRHGRRFVFGVQLADEDGRPTVWPGQIELEAHKPIGRYGPNSTLGNFRHSQLVEPKDFRISQNGEAWYYYYHPNPVFTAEACLHLELNAWFTPQGSQKRLFFRDEQLPYLSR